MKSDFAFWMCAGIGTGAATGMYYDNLPAGLCFGLATGIIVNLIAKTTIRNSNNK